MPLPYDGCGEYPGVAAAMAPSDEGAAERQRSWGREIPFGLTEEERRQVGYGRKFVQRENHNISAAPTMGMEKDPGDCHASVRTGSQ